MRQLNATLSRLFSPPKQQAKKQPEYAAFRAECKRLGVTYKIARDGYIELSDGRAFTYYGDWFEALEKLRDPNFGKD